MSRRRVKLALISMPLLLFLFNPVTAIAAPSIYYQTIYVGNQWTQPGTYDDSIPEEDTADTNGEIVADSQNSDGDYFTSYELKGSIGTGAQVNVQFYNAAGTVIGSAALLNASLNKQISVPSALQPYGISFTSTEQATENGSYYLYETWSTDTDISSSGQVLWATPPWASTSGGSTTTTTTSSTSTTGTTDYITTNVSVTMPPPPDWNQVAQDIANAIISQIPPIPAPPTGATAITASSAVTAPNLNVPTYTTPTVTAPSGPPDMGTSTYDFSSYTPINIPTSDSMPFTLSDPTNAIPHQNPGTILIPGSAPSSTMIPGLSGLTYPDPTSGGTAPTFTGGPTAAPQPNGSATGASYVPPVTTAVSGPSPPAGVSTSVSGPMPGGITGVSSPTYSGGTSGSDTPFYNLSPVN